MKTTTLPTLLCLLALTAGAHAQESAPTIGYDALRVKAAAEKSDLLILARGTPDWDKGGQVIQAQTFAKAAWISTLPKGVLPMDMAVPDNVTNQIPQSSIDELRRLGREVPKQPEPTGKNPDSTFNLGLVWNFPALVYQDANGQTVGILEGLDPKKHDAKALAAQVAAWRKARIARDALLEKAKSATGLDKARLLGQALDALPFKAARWHGRVIAELRAADPKDEIGYVCKYTYNLWDFGAEMRQMWDRQETEKGLALICKRKAQPVLTLEQKQAVEVQRYVLLRLRKGREAEAEEALKTALAMDPTSDTGIGCKGVLIQIANDREYQRLTDAVLAAEKAGDAAAYAKVADEILASPLAAPHLAKARNFVMPKFDRPAGTLLSKRGVLSFSRETMDNPLLHPLALRDDEPGLCVLQGMVGPWIQVDLTKNASITGMVVVNRTDLGKDWQLPLTVFASADGKAWQEIYRSDKALDVWEVKVPAGLKARYVRVRRDGASGHYFNVSNILIYGNP